MHYFFFFFFSSRRRHTRSLRDWSSDVCSSDLSEVVVDPNLSTADWSRVASPGTSPRRSLSSATMAWSSVVWAGRSTSTVCAATGSHSLRNLRVRGGSLPTPGRLHCNVTLARCGLPAGRAVAVAAGRHATGRDPRPPFRRTPGALRARRLVRDAVGHVGLVDPAG